MPSLIQFCSTCLNIFTGSAGDYAPNTGKKTEKTAPAVPKKKAPVTDSPGPSGEGEKTFK